METRLREWREPLDLLIQSVSHHYSEFFKQIGCVGAVKLDEPEDKVCDVVDELDF